MFASELLKQVYTKFYNQKEVLNEAPLLTQDPSVSSFNNQKADIELAGLVSYLMGVTDIQKEKTVSENSCCSMLSIISGKSGRKK